MLRVGFACCEFDCANPFGQYTYGDSAHFYCLGHLSCVDWPFHFAAIDESVVCKPLKNFPNQSPFHRQSPDSNNSVRRWPTENRSRHRMNTGKSPRNNTTSAQTQLQ